ncbi:MAG: alginate export family protein [Pseudomonadales bacterium]|nr:alginate export family protein [Pseudomonadales bacterium]
MKKQLKNYYHLGILGLMLGLALSALAQSDLQQNAVGPSTPVVVQAADGTQGTVAVVPQTWNVSFSGSQRTRYSRLNNQFRPGLDSNDEALSLRTLLRVDATRGPLSFVAELQDSRSYLDDKNSALSTIEINTLEPLQAYVGLRLDDVLTEDATLDLQLGRVTMDLGGRRLMARNRFRNTIQNYTGLTAHWTSPDKSELTTFFVLPVSVRPADREGLQDNDIELDAEDRDLRFWGLFYERPNFLTDITAEFYVFGLDESDDPRETQTRDRELYTPGFRLIREPSRGGWDIDFENTLQFGSRRATSSISDTRTLDVFAHFHHLAVGYVFTHPWLPRLSMEYDFGSGEGDTNNGNYGRFDSLFGPRRAEFGPTGIYGILGRENIHSLGLRMTVIPGTRSDAFISWRANYLDKARDSFARSGLRDPAGNAGKFAGHQIEWHARYWLLPNKLRLEVGGAVFLQGGFLKHAPNANGEGDPLHVYTDLTYSF